MARTLLVASMDDSGFDIVTGALNAQLRERGIVGDGDAMDASFDVSLSDACMLNGWTLDFRPDETYVVSMIRSVPASAVSA